MYTVLKKKLLYMLKEIKKEKMWKRWTMGKKS